MGADIHLLLEKRRKKEKVVNPYYTEGCDWKLCRIIGKDNYSSTWGDRIYGMFAILADVRNLPHWHITPLPYRGFPKDACPDTIRHYGRPVKETFESEDDDEYFYLRSKAEDWVSRGYSKFYKIRDQDYCSCPDWHSPNWCTTEELEECINKVFKDDSGNWKGEPDEWLALLGAMKGYETTGEFECRAVFWFDS